MPFAAKLCLVLFLLGACSPAPASGASPTQTAAAPSASPTPEPTATPPGGPDLAGKSIKLYHFCAISGDLAAFNFSAVWATQDLVAAINQAGGIFGAQLELELVDTGGDLEAAASAYRRTLSRDDQMLAILVCDAITEAALAPLVASDDIPTLGPGLAPVSAYRDPGGGLFAYRSPGPIQFSVWLDYLAAHWAAIRPAGAGDEIRLALYTWPEELGGFMDEEQATALAADAGIELAQYAEISAERSANVYDLLYAARDANVNAVFLNTRAFGSADLLNAVNALGLRDRLVLAGPSSAFDDLDAYLLDPAHLDAVRLTANSATWSDVENPSISFAQNLFTASERESQYHSLSYLHILAAVDIVRHAIEQVVLDEGLDGLDADSLRAALFDLSNYEVLGGLYTIAYQRTQRFPIELFIYEIDTETDAYLLLDRITLD